MILVADADSQAARQLASYFSLHGFRAAHTPRGEDALRLAYSGRLGLAIVDVTLLDMSGHALAFRLKLLVPAGLQPQLAACATCGARRGLGTFSPSAGGVVCDGCGVDGFPLSEAALAFMASALSRRLADVPSAPDLALRQAERAISDLVEYHAHVRLRPVK
jgi:hypothetical protein